MYLKNILSDLFFAWMLAKRDLKNRYANSYAGISWNIGIPLLYALINVTVFSILMKGQMGARYGDVPFSLFYFIPFSLWIFYSEVIVRSTGILREYGYLINKIAFPFWVLPLVPIASALLSQIVILSLSFILIFYQGINLQLGALFYVWVWFICFLITIGVAYAVAAISVFVPDFAQIIPVVVNITFWLTPILYPATLVEDHGAFWIRSLIMDLNPFSYLVEISRLAFFGDALISIGELVLLTFISLLIFVFGYLVFNKLKSGFADVI